MQRASLNISVTLETSCEAGVALRPLLTTLLWCSDFTFIIIDTGFKMWYNTIMKNCIFCNIPLENKGGDYSRKRFCSSLHQYKSWRASHPERAREISQATKKKCNTQHIEYNKRYYQLHKEEMRIKLLAWRRRNKAKVVQQVLLRRYRERGSKGSHTLKEWEKLKEQFNFRCVICKKQEPEIKLTRDHIIPITHQGTNYINNIQPLCRPCNSRKFNHI